MAKDNAALTRPTVAADGAVWFGMLRAGSLGRLRNAEVKTFKLPRDVVLLDSLPRNASGKVLKQALRQRDAGA